MTDARLAEIEARLQKPTPEPFASLLAELVQAVKDGRAGRQEDPEKANADRIAKIGKRNRPLAAIDKQRMELIFDDVNLGAVKPDTLRVQVSGNYQQEQQTFET